MFLQLYARVEIHSVNIRKPLLRVMCGGVVRYDTFRQRVLGGASEYNSRVWDGLTASNGSGSRLF